MKDPIQVDWRQYPIGTPAVFRRDEPARKLKLIHKFADNDVLFVCDETSLVYRRGASGCINDSCEADNDILLLWSHAIAEGHNPDKLTNEQVGEGYRLVDTQNEPFNPEAEVYWSSPIIDWKKTRANNSAYVEGCTYRLPIKSKLSAKDFPPGTVVRFTGQHENSWNAVVRVTPNELYIANGSVLAFDESLSTATAMRNVTMQRSLNGGKTWLAC